MATITKSDELRFFNRSRVLKCLRDGGSQSRTSLGEKTGISAATVTQVTADLIDDGVIVQISPKPSSSSTGNARRGRPQVMLELCPKAATTAVLTLLLNKIEVTLYDYAGNQLHNVLKRVVTAKLSAVTLERRLCETLDRALDAEDQYRASLKHISVVCQGTVTSNNSGLLWSPVTPVRKFDFRRVLQSRYGSRVNVTNDSNTIANALYAEQIQTGYDENSSKGKKQSIDLENNSAENNFGVIFSSYGIGLGFYHQGSIVTGSHSSGTEFGHMLYKSNGALCRCGRFGCIEAYAADYAIWRKAKALPADSSPMDFIPEDEFAGLIEVATQRPGPERNAFIEAGAAIGLGLTNLFAIFDPFPVFLVGTSSLEFDLMKQSLFSNLYHYAMSDSSGYLSVYEEVSERELIREGASLQALSYIDEEIFGFGARVSGSSRRNRS